MSGIITGADKEGRPLHTFAVCAYKDSPYLEACIRSLTEQQVKTDVICCTSTPSPYIEKITKKYAVPLYVREGESNIREDWLFAWHKAGGRLVLATSKPEPYAKEILEHFHLMGYFDFVSGSQLDGTRSKKGEVIAYALGHCGKGAEDKALMVGDRKHDVQGALENGLPCAGVLYGYGSREELEQAGAQWIWETPAQLSQLARL